MRWRAVTAAYAGIILVGLVAALSVWMYALRPAPARATAALNDLSVIAAKEWPNLEGGDFATRAAQYGSVSVVDASGALVFDNASTHGPDFGGVAADGVDSRDLLPTVIRHARASSLSTPVLLDGTLVGILFFDDNYIAAEHSMRTNLALIASLATASTIVLSVGIIARINARIVTPFQQMEGFARSIAAGNLEAPLPRDRSGTFGAWMESLDLMRTQVLAARNSHAEAQAAKHKLVADIGHEIKTPLATIVTTSELIEATNADAPTRERAGTISAQAQRINTLVTDLLQAQTSPETEITVTCEDIPAARLATIVAECDPKGLVEYGEIPQVLIHCDPARLVQVVGNIIANSYKYAGTAITATATLDAGGDALVLEIADFGRSLPQSHEIALLPHRSFRGSNAVGVPGQGLGLHTAARLIEAMGGDLDFRADPGEGFTVILRIRLS